MKSYLITILLLISFSGSSQIFIKGLVTDEHKKPLTGANIYIKSSYSGATSDTSGNFHFYTNSVDSQIIVVSYLSYETNEKTIYLNKSEIQIDFILKELTNLLEAVTINASTFETGDSKRAVLLKPLDIITTANSEGDIYGMLSTLPGVQEETETGKIIVRGGESNETKTFMDGMLISSPYTSRMPDIPARGRFSPLLFNGLLFSTGGYSAEYGQALSSVISLNTGALEEENLTCISLMSVGTGLGTTRRFSNSSFSMEANYTNLALYFAMIKHKLNWEKVPEIFSGNLQFRKKTGENGMIKSFLSGSSSVSSLNYFDYEKNLNEKIHIGDNNIYHKTTFNTALKRDWILKTGLSYTISKEKKAIEKYKIADRLNSAHLKILIEKQKEKISLKAGNEIIFSDKAMMFHSEIPNFEYNTGFIDFLYAGFLESDLSLNKTFALRAGGRYEYSSYLNKMNIAPRLALAYKINNNSQISSAYGIFYQHVNDDYLMGNSFLDFENASHYILNYQYTNNNRLLRIETFRKEYKHLLTFQTDGEIISNASNDGNGYAQGIDVFWRDKKTLKNTDYWISYSYIDSKRKYRDFPVSSTPTFLSKHNLSVVIKYWLDFFDTQISTSFVHRSGRPYFNPNSEEFLSDKTKQFNDLSLSLSYLTNLFSSFTIIHLSCSNVPGFNNINGYNFGNSPDSSGNFQIYPNYPYAKRTIIIGIFISIN